MRFYCALTLVAALAVMSGCSKESAPGGPGAEPAAQGPASPDAYTSTPLTTHDETVTHDVTTPAATTADHTDADEMRTEDTFTLKVPSTAKNVAQGGSESVAVSLNRGDQFNQPVTLKFETPDGIKISPENPSVPGNQSEATVTVNADADAAIGEHQIRVIATPQTGKAVEMMMAIDVTAP